MTPATDSLTIEQQVGQAFAAGFSGTTPDEHILDLIQRRHVGSVILFSRNIQSAPQLLELTTGLQRAAREAGHPAPLLIMTDQEGGLVRRLGSDSSAFPGNMALGAARSEALTCEVTRAAGRELAAQGINMNLAPVVDINSNPANPVIGVRSFGEDPDLVARLGVAAAAGYAAGGVLPTLKHFPGHGDTAIDSHRALPVLSATHERLAQEELVPFVRGIEQGGACVLVSHVALPALTPANEVLPASLSPAIVQGLLRDELGFSCVAVTDCLEMNAVAEGIGVARGAVLALQAGNDLVLVSHRRDRQTAAVDAVVAAVASGELASARVQEAAARVLRLKQRHLSWDALPMPAGLEVVGSPAHRALAARAYAASTTVVRDRTHQMPLRLPPDARLLVVVVLPRAVTAASDSVFDTEALLASVRRYHPASTLMSVVAGSADDVATACDAARAAGLVLLATVDCHLHEPQRAAAAHIAEAAARVVSLAACDPYDAGALPQIGTFLASYEYSAPALVAAVDVLFGRQPAMGRLPVTV